MAKTSSVQESNVIGTRVIINYPTINKAVEVDYAELPAEIQQAAGLHGLKQKLGDAKSGGTAAEKYDMASRIVEALLQGKWELSGGGEGGKQALVEALVEHTGRTEQEILAAYAKADDEKLKAWRKAPAIDAIIKRKAAERAAAKAAETDDEFDL